MSLPGRVVLVTGAGAGIGAACARACAAAGARVGVLDIDPDAAERVARACGEGALALVADVADYDAVEAVCARFERDAGPVYGLVANAGIGDYSLMADGDIARWRRLIEINLLGVAHAIRAVVGEMKQRGAGHVVLMASIAGRETWAGEPLYIASKHALVGIGGSLRKECAADGVGVTLVEPTIVDTPLVRGTEAGREELEAYAALSPDDVARAVVFALSQPEGVSVSELVVRAIGPEL